MHVLICHNLIIERYGKQMKTGAQVIEEMRKRGETVTAWANKNGFTVQQVQNVVCGRAKGNWGISHAVAVKLGMKNGVIVED